MFDVPADATYVWLGVATASLAVLGVATALPNAAAPDATAAARAVDAVAAGPPGSHDVHRIDAHRLRLGPHRIALSGPGGTSHATFAYGPVVPVGDRTPLAKVLHGRPPTSVFESSRELVQAVTAGRNRDPSWESAPDRLAVRTISWGDLRVTLVG